MPKITERNGAIDGLRGYSAICIVMMHVLTNGEYTMSGFIFNTLIPSFADLVFLFMSISSFSMCCGYYEKITNRTISIVGFYSKRYKKILPFFAVLCVMDFIVSPSVDAIYEVFANLTLAFGFLPNVNMKVIGVGWFLGLVFVFYIGFPFFCYLINNKKRAFVTLACALVFNILCKVKFEAGRSNITYSFVFFVVGGLIYLYYDKLVDLKKRYRLSILISLFIVSAVFFLVSQHTIVILMLCALALSYAISGRSLVLDNVVTKFLGGISMEIYLSHMLVFRIIEKLRWTRPLNSELLSYFVVVILTVVGAIIFSLLIKKCLYQIERIVSKLKNR